MTELVLTGLDGRNPIAFLAALGVLNALSDHAKTSVQPRLSWKSIGAYRPVLVDGPPREELVAILADDVASFRGEPAILELREPSDQTLSKEDDLKPRPDRFAAYLRAIVRAESPRSLALAAALGTDVATDNNGNTKPTALHFTAGQQQFLMMVGELIKGVTTEDLQEALFGPWRYGRPLPVLQWDNASARDYALRSTDPSKEKKLGVPGADWLGFRGLSFLRVAPIGHRIATTGCRGEWKSGAFRWPIWSGSLTRATIASLVTSSEVFDVKTNVLKERGISVVFESSIKRSDQGGYGSFSPAHVAQPESPTRRVGRGGGYTPSQQ
jgi:hypothetical protein